MPGRIFLRRKNKLQVRNKSALAGMEFKVNDLIKQNYGNAKAMYAKLGVDTDKVLKRLAEIPISVNCWQGDDVGGFEDSGDLTGGIAATGNYPGKARTGDELRADLEKALSLIPGKHKVSLHAMYAEFDKNKADRDKIEPMHFEKWVNWAKQQKIGLDFNGTFFSHAKSGEGFTLSHKDEKIRNFWIEHGKRSRKIGEYFGKELGMPCVTNLWIPDGFKDNPVDKFSPRKRLKDSLDKIFAEKIDERFNIDAVESKLFGIGSESYVVGSHEFYLGYAVKESKLLTLDAGHFHPTETIADKFSALFVYLEKLMLHVSRPVRWDSDHVVIFDDQLLAIAHEISRGNLFDKTFIALDFFDASINRIAAWVIGTRNTIKAFMYAMLEPVQMLQKAELDGDYTTRLALTEELKFYPFNAVWDYYCHINNVPVKENWLNEVKSYENDILLKRI